jgi:hypothetical protein
LKTTSLSDDKESFWLYPASEKPKNKYGSSIIRREF